MSTSTTASTSTSSAGSSSRSGSTPAIGSSAVYYPLSPPNLPVSPTTCLDISLFKQVIKNWRQVDDSIIIRLNRSQAMSRDEARRAGTLPTDGGCAAVFEEMVSAWTNRATMLNYCTDVVSKLATSAETPVPDPQEPRPGRLQGVETDEGARLPGRRDLGRSEGEVLKRRYETEHSVEAIVRQRSLAAFKSRCPFFKPPPIEASPESARWWDAAERGL